MATEEEKKRSRQALIDTVRKGGIGSDRVTRKFKSPRRAFSYLKGPQDMLQLYEQKYQTEVQKFGAEQIGRRRRDDYTDGEPRIPVPAQTP